MSEILNIKRAIVFSIVLYVVGVVLSVILYWIFGVSVDMSPREIPTMMYMAMWLLMIPLVLVLSKGYFKRVPPTFVRGVALGIVAVILMSLLDYLFVVTGGIGMGTMIELYTDWRWLFTYVFLIALTSYAGFEFDQTFTFAQENKKDTSPPSV